MKKILIIIPVLIIVLILALGFSLNSIVKHGVETLGPRALGAEVKLKDVDISLFSGKGQLKGLFIGNPKGFESDQAFMLKEVRLALNVKSVFSEKMIVDEIYIDAPDITYEKGGGSDNIQSLLNNIKKFSGVSEAKAEKETAAEPKGAGKKIQINRLTIKNGKVHMSMTALGGKGLDLDLPDIEMKDIGKDKEGATLSEAMEQVFGKLNTNVGSTVAGSLKDIGKTVEKTVGDTVGKTVGDTVDKLKGIFGK
jgi:uncharacterized protein involved in outer membrane biogenesis